MSITLGKKRPKLGKTRKRSSGLELRLRFEGVLAELSSKFINLPPNEIDREIEASQRLVCECLGLDLCTLWQISADNPRLLILTHYYRPLGGPPPPEQMDAREHFPWCTQQLVAGNVVIVNSIGKVPPEAARDREAWLHYGVRTALTFPLMTGGEPLFGALSFNDIKAERTWDAVLVKRLQLVAQIFANALARKRSEQALRESAERLKLAADSGGVGLWSLNLGSGCFWLTEKTQQLFELPGDKTATLEQLLAVVHPEDRGLIREAMDAMVRFKKEGNVEYRIFQADGRLKWIGFRGHVQCNGSGEPEWVMGACVDITQRKGAEERLRESEARFRIVADCAPVMIWMSGSDKLCTFLNKAWLEFTGRSLEQEMGNGWAEGVHPSDEDRCLKTYVEAFDLRKPFLMEYRLKRHDGKYRWISDTGTPRYDDQGNFSGYIGSCVDVTERKLTEEKFRLAVDASPDAMILVNWQGRIVLTNAQANRMFGYGAEEMIGRPIEILVPECFQGGHPSHPETFSAALERRAMGIGRQLFGRRKDGSEFPVEIGLNPIQTDEGPFVLSAIVDVTERRRAEIDRQRLSQELTHAGRVSTLGQLASALAHELSQPLGAILRNTEAAELFLRSPAPDMDEIHAILADIRKDDRRAAAIIDRMRGLLKRRDPEWSAFSLADLVEEVAMLVRPDALHRQITLEAAIPAELPEIRGDRVQLQQVLLNLIVNGMDAVADVPTSGRRVQVAGRLADPRTIEVAVADSGPGIQKEKLARLFDPFYTTKPHGMGLGLPISQTIITAHGGKIWAENEAGATFFFTVPVVGSSQLSVNR